MNVARLPATVIAAVIGAALCVLPGLGIRAVLRIRQRRPMDELMIATAVSVITLGVVAGGLLAFRSFSGLTLALPLVILGLLGIPRAIVLGRRALRTPVTLVLALASWPWWWSAARDGAPPAPLFQWYYWNLGRVLGTTNGIPSHVTEFGTHIRWLPDYLVFNAYSEAYRSLAVLGSRTNAIVALRVPVAALAIVAVFAVLRLWLPSWAAVLGTFFVIQSAWFLDKFNAYKPEAFGIIIGLIAIRLAVRALREHTPATFVLVGVLIGVNLTIHPIAATVGGMLLAGAIVGELVVTRELLVRRTITTIGVAVLLALVMSGAFGWALQGRVSVLGDAANPHRLADGTDPTLVLTERDAGRFGPVHEPSIGDEMSGYFEEPFPGRRLDTGFGALLCVVIAGGLVLAVAQGGLARKAVVTLGSFSLLLTVGVLWFTLNYDTFVPRHTGLARFVQYAPLVIAFGAAIALASYVRTIAALPVLAERSRRRLAAGAGVVVVAVVGVATVHTITDAFSSQTALGGGATETLDYLREHVRPDDVILANTNTRGLLEFWTAGDDPLAARQAFLEAPDFVTLATRTLEDSHRFFTGTGAADLPDRLHVDWIVVSPTPAGIGGAIPLGATPPGWSVPGFHPVHQSPTAVVLRRDHPLAAGVATGHPVDHAGRFVVATLVTAVAVVGSLALLDPESLARWWPRGRRRRRRPRNGAPPRQARSRLPVRTTTPRNPSG